MCPYYDKKISKVNYSYSNFNRFVPKSIMDFISVNDELIAFKHKLKALGIQILKFEKIGNGNMAAYQFDYTDESSDAIKRFFFWRHDMDNAYLKFENKYGK